MEKLRCSTRRTSFRIREGEKSPFKKGAMELEDFKILTVERFRACLDLMCGKKNEEYSRNNDKLHNFKTAAMIRNITPEDALIGMWLKHLVSVFDIVDDLPKLPDNSILEEKITDSINYLVLLEALIKEREGKGSGRGT